MRPARDLVLEGSCIHDIPGFYDEINRVFMANESWRIGQSLDALDDMLRGGYGAAQGADPVILHWRDMAGCRDRLGRDTTRRWLQAKLAAPGTYNGATILMQLDALDRGDGPSYFEIILGIIDGHAHIRLVPE